MVERTCLASGVCGWQWTCRKVLRCISGLAFLLSMLAVYDCEFLFLTDCCVVCTLAAIVVACNYSWFCDASPRMYGRRVGYYRFYLSGLYRHYHRLPDAIETSSAQVSAFPICVAVRFAVAVFRFSKCFRLTVLMLLWKGGYCGRCCPWYCHSLSTTSSLSLIHI